MNRKEEAFPQQTIEVVPGNEEENIGNFDRTPIIPEDTTTSSDESNISISGSTTESSTSTVVNSPQTRPYSVAPDNQFNTNTKKRTALDDWIDWFIATPFEGESPKDKLVKKLKIIFKYLIGFFVLLLIVLYLKSSWDSHQITKKTEGLMNYEKVVGSMKLMPPIQLPYKDDYQCFKVKDRNNITHYNHEGTSVYAELSQWIEGIEKLMDENSDWDYFHPSLLSRQTLILPPGGYLSWRRIRYPCICSFYDDNNQIMHTVNMKIKKSFFSGDKKEVKHTQPFFIEKMTHILQVPTTIVYYDENFEEEEKTLNLYKPRSILGATLCNEIQQLQ